MVASAFVWLYAFDHASALWVVLFLVPVAAAARFALPGAMAGWVAVAGLYVAREVWAAGRYGIELSISSVTFRVGMRWTWRWAVWNKPATRTARPWWRSPGDRSVTIEVRDHGEGVPDVLQPDLFQAFNRHAAVSDRASVGLGLWVTAQLIDAHGGTIGYRQAPDGGATFTITLPAPAALAATDGATVAPPASDDPAALVANARPPS